MSSSGSEKYSWLRTGEQALAEMLAAIDQAASSVRFEMYIYNSSPIGFKCRRALVKASRRGLKVQVLIDSLGSVALPRDFWTLLEESGGEVRWFNPISLFRFGVRDHRKVIVCDKRVAFIGGFNVAPEYEGDGVTSGWRDLGMKVRGPVARDLARGFDEMFALANPRWRSLARWRHRVRQRAITHSRATLFLSSPGWGRKLLKQSLLKDIGRAKEMKIISAYFLPTLRMRRAIMKAARSGRQVQLILPGKSDVILSQWASRSLYRRFLRAGVEIYEYEPQILHAKLMILGEVVYAGSANLDTRSLFINYELLLRIERPEVAAEARDIFARDLEQSRRIDEEEWAANRTFWDRLKQRWAYFLLARVDSHIARRQWKHLR
jgi:cardiolipin synthase A/B